MVMQHTLLDRDDPVSRVRGPLTMLSDGIERLMPLLAHGRVLSPGARSVFRPYPTAPHAAHVPWDGSFRHLPSECICEPRLPRRGMTARSVTRRFTHDLTHPSFGGYRHG